MGHIGGDGQDVDCGDRGGGDWCGGRCGDDDYCHGAPTVKVTVVVSVVYEWSWWLSWWLVVVVGRGGWSRWLVVVVGRDDWLW